MKLIYCPYSDRKLRESETNWEHIIPLALGGSNKLLLRVNAGSNAALGSELDGRLANEFLMAIRRTKYDTRGHSGKEPWATIKHASYGDDAKPAQAHIHRKHGLRIWDPQDQKEKKGAGLVRMTATLDIDLPVRFVAKIALAAGYFAYGDLFRNHVDHHQFRQVMTIDPANLNMSEYVAQLEIDQVIARVDHYLYDPPSKSDWKLLFLRRYCSEIEGSVVILIPGPNCFQVTVGILGQFLATISVPANTTSFPNEGEYCWGHAISVVQNKLQRRSWLNCLQKWARELNRE